MVKWLCWAIKEFSLEGVQLPRLTMDGDSLVKMPKEDFLARAPPFMGDILWEHLDMLQKGGLID